MEECLLKVKSFSFHNSHEAEMMNGNPEEGRIYIAQKLFDEYRVHIGREKTNLKLDGIRLSGLKGSNDYWEWEVVELEPSEAIQDPDLHPEDVTMIKTWLDSDRKSKFFPKDNNSINAGELSDLQKLQDVIKSAIPIEEEEDEGFKALMAQEDIIMDYFNVTLEKDKEFHDITIDVLAYLLTTYDDKYQNSDLDTVGIINSKYHGKGFNVGNAFKYISRYLTEGYDKSNNPQDLMKAIHYLLFELRRRNIHG